MRAKGEPSPRPLCIVGVGASAGGLEAFTQLLGGIPANPGAALVLVQHLDPKHQSILASLLSRATTMPVHETRDGMRLEADHVYVIPPAVDIELAGGHIRHVPRGPRREAHLPIDLFLRTLAEAKGDQAIAVVLSGTGMDGTLGCKAVRLQGGITFAQEPASAKFDGMPHSAILAGCVDFVLPPADIGREIVRLARGQYVRETPPEPARPAGIGEDGKLLDRIFVLLKKATGADFTCYRQSTLKRRIQRRMAVHRIERLSDYVTVLESRPEELQDLHQDLLINVTSFFRDPETFEVLNQVVFPRIVRARNADSPVRVWVPGCATGEEAYSIAISLLESQGELGANVPIQIFASDLSEPAIAKARAGLYPESIEADVSRERLLRFFIKVDGHYQVSKAVRDLLVFARQDLTRDPPFSRMDLVSCRNVLIYLEPPMQQRVMATFYYALKPTGLLVLGQSETVGASSDFFTVVHREHKVYAKRAHLTGPRLSPPTGPSPAATPFQRTGSAASEVRPDVEREAQRLLLSRYAPASVLIDAREKVFHLQGDTESYLVHGEGAASFQLAKIVRKELLSDLRRLLKAASARNAPQRKEGVLFTHQGRARRVALEVIPLRGSAPDERCFQVLFDESRRRRAPVAAPLPRGASGRRTLSLLQQELQVLRQHQQDVQDEQEGANEELQSANEEIVSSNEELQSINEELETAKEELQSNNEELMTLNEELQTRNAELQRLHDDLDNVLASTTLPLLLLDQDLVLRRYTPAAASTLGILPGDVGRPLGRLRGSLAASELEPLVAGVLETMQPAERELRDPEGRWWRLQVRPYRTRDNRINGAVLVLSDIDALKRDQLQIQKARDLAESIVETARAPLLILDGDLRVRRANLSFCEAFGLSRAETEGALFFELADGEWDTPELRRKLDDVLTLDRTFDDYVLENPAAGRETRTLVLNGRKLRQEAMREELILLAIEDRTATRRAEAERALLLKRAEEAARQAEAANRLKDEFVANASHELRGPLTAMVTWTHLLSAGGLDGPTMARGVAAIERSAHAQTRLIEDLLDVTRITLGKLRLETRRVDLQGVVEAALESARPAAEAKGIALRVADEPRPEAVLGDAGRLQQVVWNLLSNAVKFTSKGGTVEVSWGRVGAFVEIKVSDDGQGIDPRFLPHVFERFRQADGSTSRPQPGLGLGLSIVRQLVELHGGTVRASSPGEGRGATFAISLPVPGLGDLPQEMAATPTSVGPGTWARPSLPSLHGLHVLVVDDDADSCDAVKTVLELRGARATTAASVVEALAAFDEAPPDVLVSDIGMPVRDGFDLIRAIRSRSHERGGAVPALALTAYAAVEDRQKTAAAGFQAYLAKPAEPWELVTRIGALVGR